MSDKPIWRQWLGLPILVVAALAVAVAIFVLSVNENEDQITQSATTLAATAQATSKPEAAVVLTEPTAKEPTAAPTEEAVPEVESVPTEPPATGTFEMEEYVSVTEFFSVKIPAGWTSEETFPGGALVMANSEAALERFSDDQALESGDLVLNVGFLPFELFRQREVVPLDIQFEATPDVFMRSILPVFRVSGEAVHGDVALVSVGDERDGGLMAVSDERHEGLILMVLAGDEVVSVISAVGAPGEVNGFYETILAVAAGVTFSGDQGALYGALLEG